MNTESISARARMKLRPDLLQNKDKHCTARPSLIPPDCGEITPQMLPQVKLTAEQINTIAQAIPGSVKNIQDIYPLTPIQEGMLLHNVLGQGVDRYVVLVALEFASNTRLAAFIDALGRVIARHDALRTAVLWEKLAHPVQVVYRHASLPIEQFEIVGERSAFEQLQEQMNSKDPQLSLKHAPLMRLRICADTRDTRWYGILLLHHLVCDGLALQVMVTEVMAFIRGAEDELVVPIQYRDHVAQALEHARSSDAEAFFRRKLGNIDEPTVPYGLLNIRDPVGAVNVSRMTIESALAGRIRAQMQRHRVSVAVLFHAAWALVVARLCGRSDFVFGTVLFGRSRSSGGRYCKIGNYLSTLPLSLHLRGVAIEDLIQLIHGELLELLNYEQTSLAIAQRCSGVPGSSPLFNTLLNFRYRARDSRSRWTTADCGIREIGTRSYTNYPITLSVDDEGDGFELTAQTDSCIEPDRIISYMYTALEGLIGALDSTPRRMALELSILPEREWHQIVNVFNASSRPHSAGKLVHELFEEQVRLTPEAVAATCREHSLTYSELNARSNQLARYLREKGVVADQLVGLFVERGLEMIVGLLGILKAGGAYLPLDCDDPVEQLQYMLKDTVSMVLMTSAHLRRRCPAAAAEIIALDSAWTDIVQQSEANLERATLGVSSDNLACVTCTSGSAGRPKAAMNEHRALVNGLQWMRSAYGLTVRDRALQQAPFSSGAAFWELFWPLVSGAGLVFAKPEGSNDSQYLQDLIETEKITTLYFSPSMLRAFLDDHCLGRCSGLRQVMCGGEPLSARLRSRFFDHFPETKLHNLYGTTEAAVNATAWECQPMDQHPWVPIGRPISNCQIYILDQQLRPTPIGIAGKIFIGGVAVGRGYLNQPALSAEYFYPDPFNDDRSARIHRTGDWGRWRGDGVIECLYPNVASENQGCLRTELADIAAQLMQHAHVKEAIAVAREDMLGEKRIVAYVVLESATSSPSAVNLDELHDFLLEVLPEHLLPVAFVVMERFPLTTEGKVDRWALPAPECDTDCHHRYEAPQGPIEEALSAIWADVLKVSPIGRHDNFFELGGHSLSGMELIMTVAQTLNVYPPVAAIFRYPTLHQMAQLVGSLLSDTSGEVASDRSKLEEGVV